METRLGNMEEVDPADCLDVAVVKRVKEVTERLQSRMVRQFPLKPFLDRVIVEVIPISQYYEYSDNVEVLLDRTFSQKSDRGIVKSIGDGMVIGGNYYAIPFDVGDVVQFDPATAYAGLIYLNPAHEKQKDKPEYLQIRVGDLLGKVVQQSDDTLYWRNGEVISKEEYEAARA